MQNNHHHTGADRAFTAKGAAALCTVLFAVCLMGTMTACSSKEKKQIPQTAASRAEQRRADSLALKVAVTPTTDCLPVFVAKERGLFDDHGVAVSLKCKQSHMDCDQAMLDEKVEMMASDLMRTERLIHNGLPLTYVTSTNAYWQLIGNRLSRVRKVDQLGDKMMGMSRYSATDYLGTLAVDSAKPKLPVFRIQINDVDVRLKMLVNNEIDAVMLTEPQATAARMQRHNVLFDSRHRDISLGVLAIRTKAVGDARIRQQRDAFVKAYNQACDSINQRGLAAYADVLKKYCHVDDSIIGRLPKMEFQHAAQPRTADVERTKNVKWKTF